MSEKHIDIIKAAVKSQAEDDGIWFIPRHITEDYLQQQLRDLHRVIEDADIDAFNRIIERNE